MNRKLPVCSLKINFRAECSGNCGVPLGIHRTVTVDTYGNPVRFGSDCNCFRLWQERNLVSFLRSRHDVMAL
jgi:hypothetical protein